MNLGDHITVGLIGGKIINTITPGYASKLAMTIKHDPAFKFTIRIEPFIFNNDLTQQIDEKFLLDYTVYYYWSEKGRTSARDIPLHYLYGKLFVYKSGTTLFRQYKYDPCENSGK